MPENLTFDHYEVLTREDGSPHELGRGAMGITYKAFDTSLRIPVALKVINATYLESEVARQRFIREARSAAKLRHRHVASVFHLGIDGDAYFYAMEFIDGETVDALIKREGPLVPVIAMRIAAQVARALNAAQPHGLVHRDIKPANLMLIREDDELIVKVIDFGLAKSSLPGECEEDAATLSTGGFVGTPHFASPEQLAEQELDVRSDIYSLGVTLWYMLSGQTPFAGSTAQVMSQHLSRSPPFEKLHFLPPPVTALLGQMLHKEASHRQQTAVELRKQIEACIESVAGSLPAGSPPATATRSAADSSTPGPIQFAIGTTVAGHYRIEEKIGDTNSGMLWRAQDIKAGRPLRLLLLNGDLLNGAEAYTAIEREVERAAKVRHPNLLEIYALESVERASFIATEWIDGFTLLELLRARRELKANEVVPLLDQAARGIDHALASGLAHVDLSLHHIFLHFPGALAARETIMRQPIAVWPPFVVKVYPLGITGELALSGTWAGGQTIVGDHTPLPKEDARTCYIRGLGSVVYELLGGSISAIHSGSEHPRYTPLASLSETGNDVVRKALNPECAFASAGEFAETFSKVTGREVSWSAPAAPIPTPNRPLIEPPPQPETGPPPMPGVFAGGISTPARGISIPLGAAALLGVIAAFFAYQRMDNPRDSRSSSLETRPPPISAPIAPEPDKESADVTPPAPMPVPAKPPEPAPPSPQELLKAAVREADALEAKKDWPGCLKAWLEIARSYPEVDSAKVHLEMILDTLGARSEEVNQMEFPDLRPLITEAAELDVIAAMMFLGDALRKSEPVASFNWYSAAAARGQVTALRQVGLMLANGANGTERQPEKAVYYFQEASQKGDIAAKYLLGECYLRGNGVIKDEKLAVDLLGEAADAGNLFALDLLGTCYHQGLGVPKDFGKALQLFTVASDRGYAVSTGNLGVLHMKGDGLQKPDPQKAVEFFQKGIRSGDGNCMYFYALCLETGMGVGANRVQAQGWYVKAAATGNKQAIEWCRQNGIPPAGSK